MDLRSTVAAGPPRAYVPSPTLRASPKRLSSRAASTLRSVKSFC